MHSVRALCTVLGVATSGFSAWLTRPASARTMADQDHLAALQTIQTTSGHRYGSRRLRAALAAQGPTLSRDHVRRLIRLGQLQPQRTRRRRRGARAARPSRDYMAANILNRQFDVVEPNTWWVGDITTITTAEGDLHLAGVLDLGGREVIGWATAATQTTDLVVAAFHAALQRRGRGPCTGHHTDQGAGHPLGHTSHAYQALVAGAGVTPSMSRPGCCHDNAPMESFWATLKSELTQHQRYATRADAQLEVFWYIEVFYNRHRLHSSLGYQSPAAYLARWGQDNPPVRETET